VNGVPVAFLYYYLLTLMAVTIVISMKVVGIILVSALLVIPAAAAYEVSSHYKSVLIVSVIVGLVSALGGLLVSYRFNTASGATIVLLAAAVFLLLFTIRSLRTGPKKDRVPVHGPSDPQG